MGATYITNEEHYSDVLLKALEAKRTLWMNGTKLSPFCTAVQ